ncbi:uncharacterized protein LOC6030977 isoform X1 [Culex quinquefasciatus]|uniref:uncharacterized protein LOC6030977 isoform X1 n=1 Tax=Culex quinquefasciatus TaxID=7176 RepID=UPI0018E3C9A1|nr:uncharacterized protein LOC6030977 isoform X1 [Culex quinquefasciatus]
MSFEDKKKALFASLDSAEKSIPSDSVLHQDQNADYSRVRRRPGSDSSRRQEVASREPIRKFRGKESIFKRPAAPIGKCLPMTRVPDFKKNPHKWTKYSLEDVDTSDRSNTAAAFSFLREIESQKRDQQQHEDEEGPTEFKSKVRFNRSVKLQARLEEVDKPPPTEEDKPKVKGCKVVMPEYVVGQKPKKSRPVKVGGGAAGGGSSKRDRSSELKLDHLMEEEDDEEDDNDGMD